MYKILDQRTTLAFILAVVFFSLMPALGNGLLYWDDVDIVTENLSTRSLAPENIQRIFSDKNVGTYIPLTVLSFAFERHFFGLNPVVFHLTNILLHLGVVALIFYFCLNLGFAVRAAAIASVIFGIHPIHVESVAWVSARKDALCALFYLLSFWTYFQYCKENGLKFYSLSLVCGVMSILSKPMAYSLPFELFLCDYLSCRKMSKSLFFDKIPFFALIGAVSLVTFDGISTHSAFDIYRSLLLQIYALCFYIIKFLYPWPLLPFYEFPQPVGLLNVPYAASLLALILLGGMFYWQRKNRLFVFGVLFYLITISVLVIRVPWDFGNNTNLADRFMYLPSLGFAIYLGSMVDRLLERSKNTWRMAVQVVLLSTALAWGVSSFEQTKIWHDDVTLWTRVIERYPQNDIGYINRAAAYKQNKQYDQAKSDYQKLMFLKPKDPKTYFVRGAFFIDVGDYKRAVEEFDTSLFLEPRNPEAYFRRGNAYYQMGEKDLARADYERTVSLNPKHTRALYNLGLYFEETKDVVKAIEFYTKAIGYDVRNTTAINNRGLLYMELGKWEKALNDFDQMLKLDTHSFQAHNNKGVVFFQQKKYELALKEFQEALRINPRYEDAVNNRNGLLMMLRGGEKQ